MRLNCLPRARREGE